MRISREWHDSVLLLSYNRSNHLKGTRLYSRYYPDFTIQPKLLAELFHPENSLCPLPQVTENLRQFRHTRQIRSDITKATMKIQFSLNIIDEFISNFLKQFRNTVTHQKVSLLHYGFRKQSYKASAHPNALVPDIGKWLCENLNG